MNKENLYKISAVCLFLCVAFLASPEQLSIVLLAVVFVVIPEVVIWFLGTKAAHTVSAIYIAILGKLFRKQVLKWLAWLKASQADQDKEPEKEPWLLNILKDYYVRLGVLLQFQAAQEQANEDEKRKKRKRRKAGHGGTYTH